MAAEASILTTGNEILSGAGAGPRGNTRRGLRRFRRNRLGYASLWLFILLLVVTTLLMIHLQNVRKSLLVPSPQVLMGLFDLTPAETRFAIGLTSGASLRDVSQSLGLTESSGRTYLARIFEKTGTHRQAELITLLSSTQAF